MLDLIPVSYWFEYLDLVFFYKCRNGLFDFDIFKYVTPYSKSRVTKNSFISIDYKRNLTKKPEPSGILTLIGLYLS